MGVVIPSVTREPVVIKFRLDTVDQTHERLVQFGAAVALAAEVLARANAHGDEAVLDKVADVLRSGSATPAGAGAPVRVGGNAALGPNSTGWSASALRRISRPR